jgi:hypothetical protein
VCFSISLTFAAKLRKCLKDSIIYADNKFQVPSPLWWRTDIVHKWSMGLTVFCGVLHWYNNDISRGNIKFNSQILITSAAGELTNQNGQWLWYLSWILKASAILGLDVPYSRERRKCCWEGYRWPGSMGSLRPGGSGYKLTSIKIFQYSYRFNQII